MKQKSETNRVEIAGTGIGEISEEMIAQRARLLATADGRTEANASDLAQARTELSAETLGDEEDEMGAMAEEDRPDSGLPPFDPGSRAPRLVPEDENNASEQEIEEGMAEAELDTRVKSRHRV